MLLLYRLYTLQQLYDVLYRSWTSGLTRLQDIDVEEPIHLQMHESRVRIITIIMIIDV